jgi:hypothetical protein
MAKLLPFGKTFLFHGSIFASWKKPLSFMVKPLAFGKTFLFHGLTFSYWQNLATSWLN